MPPQLNTGLNPGAKMTPPEKSRTTRSTSKALRENPKERVDMTEALVAQNQQTTNASGKKPQTLSTATRPSTPSKPPQTLTRIATLLEQAIYRYNPSVQFKATLEDVVEEIKKAAAEEKGRAATAVSSSAKAIYEHIKVDLSTFYEALDSKLSDLQHGQSRIYNSAENLTISSENIHAITKELDTRVTKITEATNVIENHTKSYREAVLAAPPGMNAQMADPLLMSDFERKERQLLIGYDSSDENATLQTSLMDLKSKANIILEGIEDPERPESAKVEGVSRTRDGSLLLLLSTKEAASWLRKPEIGYKLVDKFAIGARIRDRAYNILVRWIPTTFEPNSKHLREIEEVNNLLEHSIQKARWIKPVIRRRAGQARAHAIFTMNTADEANKIIRSGIDICGVRVKAERTKQEPMQCLKCRGWEHKAQDCKAEMDTCGTCGSNHRTSDCKSKDKLYCASCKTESHASWDRACPEFQRRCSSYDLKYPENHMPFFATEQSWTMTTRHSRVPIEDRFPKSLAVNSIQYNNHTSSHNLAQAKLKGKAGKRKVREGAEEQFMRREGPNFIPLGRRREEGELSTPGHPVKQAKQTDKDEDEATLAWFKDTPSTFGE